MDCKRAAEGLAGVELPGGWVLTKQLDTSAEGHSGGFFSVGYFAQKDDAEVFIKVIDIFAWQREGKPFLRSLNEATSAVLAEEQILEMCRNKKMPRIVTLLDSGQYEVPRFSGSVEGRVHFFVFERAAFDVRKKALMASTSLAWKFESLKSVAAAIQQLHQQGIAHQDIKPANVLVFNAGKQGEAHKVGDLGQASRKAAAGPYDWLPFPGDRRYGPLSGLYGFRESEWTNGREASDLYMLGNLACWLLAGCSLTERQLDMLPDTLHPARRWRGSFRDALPYLIDIHQQALAALRLPLPAEYLKELMPILAQLTHPDPCKRGDPKYRQRVGSPLGIEVFVSKFGTLAKRAQLGGL